MLALRTSSSFIRSSIKCCRIAAPGSKTRRPVSRVLFAVLPRSGSHSSGMPVARHLTRHTRGTGVKQPICAPYSVLLRAGFTVPVLSPGLRWALTPPFHPYLFEKGRFAFTLTSPEGEAVCFLWHFPSAHAGRPLAVALFPWSPDFPPVRSYPRTSGCPAVWSRRGYRRKTCSAPVMLQSPEKSGVRFSRKARIASAWSFDWLASRN